jgi:HlyD family secretion protein
MDRVIQKKKWSARRIATYIGVPLILILLAALIYQQSGTSRLKVPRERLTISTVSFDSFQEFIAINGEVLPQNTVFVTAIEGGQVKEIFLEGGETVKKGDLIIKLTNPGLELNYMNLQTNLLEQADQLRNTKINLETSGLILEDQLAQIQFQLKDLEQQYKRSKDLFEEGVIPAQDYQTLQFSYEQMAKREEIMLRRIAKDSVLRYQQLSQVEKSLRLVDRNLDAIQQSLANLTIQAPISGQLSSVRVEIGQMVTQGQRLGQVDELDGFKVRARIDEHYISRINTGLKGDFPFAGQRYDLEIRKVYPEVNNGTFEVDMEFVGEVPEGIKRGQTLQIRLALSEATQAKLLARGGFYQSTGGKWVYVLNEEGSYAYKRDIRIGRQSDRFYEVLEGLQEGEKVVTSNYQNFNEVDQLVFTD